MMMDIFADVYATYIFSSWGLAIALLLIMFALPVIKYFQIRHQLTKQFIRQQRIERKKAVS